MNHPPAPTYLNMEVPAAREHIPFVRHTIAEIVRLTDANSEEQHAVALAVTEAAANIVIHAYREQIGGMLRIEANWQPTKRLFYLRIRDYGGGMAPREDSPGLGQGMPLLEALTKSVEIKYHSPGTEIHMSFEFSSLDALSVE